MQTELKNLPKSEVELTVELLQPELEEYMEAACRELSRQNNIKGFRSGHVPKDIILKEFGEDKVKHIAMDMAVRESFSKTVLEKKLEIVGEPKISQVKSEKENDGLKYQAVFSVIPEINLLDYKKIKVAQAEIKFEASELDSILKDIQKSKAQTTVVTRPAQKGDRIEIDFTAKIDGQVIEGGESKQHPIILGEGHFMAGFEDALVGLKENEIKSFAINTPNDYHDQKVAGQKVDFEVKLNSVEERKLPELNDEFAKTLGQFSSVEDLKNNIKEGLMAEKEMKAKDERRAKISTELIKDIKVELPELLVEVELNKMAAELESSLARMGLTRESYLSHLGKNWAELKKEWQPKAESRVKVTLALRAVAKKESLEVEEGEIEEKVSEILRSAPAGPGQNIDLTALRGYVKGLVRNEKVFELLENQ